MFQIFDDDFYWRPTDHKLQYTQLDRRSFDTWEKKSRNLEEDSLTDNAIEYPSETTEEFEEDDLDNIIITEETTER